MQSFDGNNTSFQASPYPKHREHSKPYSGADPRVHVPRVVIDLLLFCQNDLRVEGLNSVASRMAQSLVGLLPLSADTPGTT